MSGGLPGTQGYAPVHLQPRFGPPLHPLAGPRQSTGCLGPGCRCCLAVLGALLALLLWVALRVGTAECTLESFDVRLAQHSKNGAFGGFGEKFGSATEENTFLDGLDLDLLGVWWMDGNPLIYEQLVSFAGSRGSPPYPTTVFAPFLLQRHWSWSDSFFGRAIVAYYAVTEPADTVNQFKFANSSYAGIVPVADVFGENRLFGFRKINADEWDRVDTYTLRRVVNADGTAGPFWNRFIAWYLSNFPDGRIVVQADDNSCKRVCQYFFLCFVCDVFC